MLSLRLRDDQIKDVLNLNEGFEIKVAELAHNTVAWYYYTVRNAMVLKRKMNIVTGEEEHVEECTLREARSFIYMYHRKMRFPSYCYYKMIPASVDTEVRYKKAPMTDEEALDEESRRLGILNQRVHKYA
ncbi:MAG: hypothetical protein K6E18_00280 [Lachnospiraceae bacterium]|nr:hypothetical protein [Lachnospiraceae bacterium]